MNVFFINPPRINPNVTSYEIPLGIVTLLSCTKHFAPEINCSVIDYQLEPELINKSFENESIYCLSVITNNKDIVYSICNKIKETTTNSIIIIGGPHVTLLKEKIFNECNSVDYISIGEGDYSIPKFLKSVINNDSKECLIEGIVSKNGKKGPVNNLINDLNELPSMVTGLQLYDIEKIIKKNGYLTYIFSRGCPFDCIYCSSSKIWKHKIRFLNSDRVCEDIRYLHSQGVKYINFRDDLFTANKKWIQPILKTLKETGIIWGCETRADCVDYDFLLQMKDCGCELVRFGVESFNQKTLDILNKKTNVDILKQRIQEAVYVGYKEIRCSLMLGLPFETTEDIENTLSVCRSFKDVFFKFFAFYPGPGTAVGENLEKYGIKFVSTDINTGRSSIETSTMTNSDINKFINKAYEYFGDPDDDIHRDFSIIFNKYRDPRNHDNR